MLKLEVHRTGSQEGKLGLSGREQEAAETHTEGRALCQSLLPLTWVAWVSCSSQALLAELTTHTWPGSGAVKDDLGGDGAGAGLAAGLCQPDEPVDKRQRRELQHAFCLTSKPQTSPTSPCGPP